MNAHELEQFRRIEALFDGALEFPAGPARDAWLHNQTAGDPGLLEKVRALLACDESVAAAPHAPETLPAFGPWQAVRMLGRGGMGVVYLAERADGAFRMSAAVKVVPLALASSDIEERFRRERQFLASLDHPKIARLIDGGVTPAGLPYLVMDYVDGSAIDRYCDEHTLDPRARISLMRQVLDALIYVHSRQVIHRDLKPSNILVDASGAVKLLDFGTARLVDTSGDSITKTGVFAFTPEYASPEQVQGKPPSFVSDIYSAGVLLYRLLTGRSPYPLSADNYAAAETISRVAPQPSGLDAPLDAIVSQALRKNPDERYQSAAEMDADLARYLEGRRVHARKPLNRRAVALVLAAAVLLAAGVWFRFGRGAPAEHPSIAVLPFTNASADPGDKYVVDGLFEEFTGELAHVKNLRVAPQSAAAVFGGQPRDIPAIGRRLSVTHLLEAGVERSPTGVKIVATLERTSDGARLWTNTYQRPMSDLHAMETDLESGIAATLKVAAPPSRKEHIPPQQAHDLYLKARFEDSEITAGANAQSQQDYRRALELDPDYAAAYAGLGDAIWNRNIRAGDRPEWDERGQAERMWLKAIELDPSLPAAHDGIAKYVMEYDWDWKRAERELQAVLAAGPNASAELTLAYLYNILGRRQEGDDHLRRAQDLDPVSSQSQSSAARLFEMEGRFQEARDLFERLANQNPSAAILQVNVNRIHARMGAPHPAIQNLAKLSQHIPVAAQALATVEALAGEREEALRTLKTLEASYPDGNTFAYLFAEAYAELGDEPATVRWLEKSMDLRELPAMNIHVDPDFVKLQDRPAFHILKKRMNLDW